MKVLFKVRCVSNRDIIPYTSGKEYVVYETHHESDLTIFVEGFLHEHTYKTFDDFVLNFKSIGAKIEFELVK